MADFPKSGHIYIAYIAHIYIAHICAHLCQGANQGTKGLPLCGVVALFVHTKGLVLASRKGLALWVSECQWVSECEWVWVSEWVSVSECEWVWVSVSECEWVWVCEHSCQPSRFGRDGPGKMAIVPAVSREDNCPGLSRNFSTQLIPRPQQALLPLP